jgi:shikimate dehydrogenase
MKQLGLIGYPLGHSFSKKYFTEKFDNQGLSAEWAYELFSIDSIEKLADILRGSQNRLVGLNVTIPHKMAVMAHLDAIDPSAAAVGAVNCIKITWPQGDNSPHLMGYNTDVIGFEKSVLNLLGGSFPEGLRALILGTGGAAKAAAFTFRQHNIPFKYVSRTRTDGQLSYDDLDKNVMQTHRLIVNSTPLGMAPNTEGVPPLPFELIDNQHFILDMIYNPLQTRLMTLAEARGAKTVNGLEMLIEQAEQGWAIWQR